MSQHVPSSMRAPLRLFVFVAIVGAPLAAEAYVGPGAGLSLMSALWGLICAIGAAFLFVILWPIRRLRRLRAEKRKSQEAGSETVAARKAGPDPAAPGTQATPNTDTERSSSDRQSS